MFGPPPVVINRSLTLQGYETVSISRDIYPNLKMRIYTTGIRQNRLAKMLGIDEAHLSRIINGFRQPSNDLQEQIAVILQSDAEWLFHKLQISDETFPTIEKFERSSQPTSNTETH